MEFPTITLRVTESRHCPLYRYGDLFSLSGIALFMENDRDNSFLNTTVVHLPPGREPCKILSSDLARIIIQYERADKVPACMLSCTGCSGALRLEYYQPGDQDNNSSSMDHMSQLIDTVMHFPFFHHIDQQQIKALLRHSQIMEHKTAEIILRKGDPGNRFYVILSGEVAILNDAGIPINTLGKGEVFGEMSLISDANVGATVQVRTDSQILSIDHKHFKRVLHQYPDLNMHLTRILAKRLDDANRVRSDDYASGLIGNLEEIPPEALFQTLNVNRKTGILTLTQLRHGTARFSLRQGSLIKASYNGKKEKEAFFSVLGEKSGRFKFTPGLPPEDFDVPKIEVFIKLLMEGMQQIDENTLP